ncbi:biogenesis of lysosome-related organelles complex 1 subunit 3-like isoform X2 [Gigantopelta aegis]|uniref:biogenesis of lysosome-related organelles complex 1 subunit 3-like isoform X2 n=1 Tax=Gigantopelta aegis TaxID=1735272 RepID=UPI001B889ECB|nr:biogenesis of lysosome-related organelles complex 1 subunit 3-like isoform X2 [Gigantopelta aegis]
MMLINATDAPQGVVVSGEAPESDEEVDTSNQNNQELPVLKVDFQKCETDQAIDPSKLPTLETTRMVTSRPKYDTLLHRKLREKNLAFHHHLVEIGSQAYLSSAKQLQNITQNLLKSHKAIQDISHNMRLLTNDLFHLEDKIDIIATCHLLPDINISK